MPESIFKQVSLDILRLHQQAIRSLIATKCCDECEVHDAVFITLDGRYYVWLPCMGKSPQSETGILLIEDEDGNTRLSWGCRYTRSQTKRQSVQPRCFRPAKKNAAHEKQVYPVGKRPIA